MPEPTFKQKVVQRICADAKVKESIEIAVEVRSILGKLLHAYRADLDPVAHIKLFNAQLETEQDPEFREWLLRRVAELSGPSASSLKTFARNQCQQPMMTLGDMCGRAVEHAKPVALEIARDVRGLEEAFYSQFPVEHTPTQAGRTVASVIGELDEFAAGIASARQNGLMPNAHAFSGVLAFFGVPPWTPEPVEEERPSSVPATVLIDR